MAHGHGRIQGLPLELFNLRNMAGKTVVGGVKDLLHNSGSINCIIGNKGVGKTQFLHSILQEWTDEFPRKKIIYLDMREHCKRCDVDDDVLKDSVTAPGGTWEDDTSTGSYYDLESILETDGRDVILLLDHMNDLDVSDPNTHVFQKLLSKQLLPEAKIITASNFLSSDVTSEVIKSSSSCQYILEGIKPGTEFEFLENMRHRFRDDRLFENFKYHCLDLSSIPGLVEELLAAFKDNPQTTSIGCTKMVEALTMRLINLRDKPRTFKEESSNSPKATLTTLSDDLRAQLRLLGKLAYQFVESSTENCCHGDLSRFLGLENGVEEKLFQEIRQGGHVFLVNTIDALGRKAFKFVHPTIQEFLAAYYIATEPLLNQIRLIGENRDIIFTKRSFGKVVKFYFGIGHILSGTKINSDKITPEAVWTRKPILESIIGAQLHLDEEPNFKRNKLLLTFQLLQESQDRNLARKFLSRREKYLELTLQSSLQLSEPLISNIVFIVGNSGISKWDIKTPASTAHSAEYIAMLTRHESSKKVNVRIHIDEVTGGDTFVIKPLAGSGSPLRESSPHSAYVKCMREVLHCCLQLYSPIRLKSNSADTSYVSFLSCACLKEKIEKDGVLLLDSLTAMHWINVKGKAMRQKDNLRTGEDAELRHHMSMHNMEHLELVFMMSPLPHRLHYKTPAGGNTMESIELFHTTKATHFAGKIATSLKDHLRSRKVADECEIAMETQTTVGRSPPVLVALPFVIPLSVMGKMVINTRIGHGKQTTSKEFEDKPRSSPRAQTKSPSEDGALQVTRYQNQATAMPRASNRRSSEDSAIQDGDATGMYDANDLKHLHNMPMSNTSPAQIYSISYQQYPQHHLRTSAPRHSSQLQYASEESSQYASQQISQYTPSHQSSQYHSQHSSQYSTSLQVSQHTPQQQYSQNTPQQSSRYTSQQSVQQSQPVSGQKQTAAPPGTVLHTANPEAFTLNVVYNIPSEDNLLKKGGNGMVFAVTYGLREYAVKKTPFRNREFQIHKRLKHPNIIELSCLMFGPPQPQYQRRYYSYHFMPRVTGDLARMVTDRRDLVMTSLTSKYHNDPLRLGSIQGNWKYILKELLKGLGYMHAMNIVHRDIKASNVLIKMLCSCDNPLTCTCSRKCSVTIADFDAALQLDSSGRLKATPSPTGTFQVVPVGTDGYRSPELSQFVTCNNFGALTPALGIKTDIWSVGLVLVRLLNGSNGPAKQLKVSVALSVTAFISLTSILFVSLI